MHHTVLVVHCLILKTRKFPKLHFIKENIFTFTSRGHSLLIWNSSLVKGALYEKCLNFLLNAGISVHFPKYPNPSEQRYPLQFAVHHHMATNRGTPIREYQTAQWQAALCTFQEPLTVHFRAAPLFERCPSKASAIRRTWWLGKQIPRRPLSLRRRPGGGSEETASRAPCRDCQSCEPPRQPAC